MPLSKASTILVRGYRGLLTRWIQLALLESVAMEPISHLFNKSHCQTNSPLHVTKTFSEGYGFHARMLTKMEHWLTPIEPAPRPNPRYLPPLTISSHRPAKILL